MIRDTPEVELAGYAVAFLGLVGVAAGMALVSPYGLLFVLPSLYAWLLLPQLRRAPALTVEARLDRPPGHGAQNSNVQIMLRHDGWADVGAVPRSRYLPERSPRVIRCRSIRSRV